jgi:manganese/zinc/iron transport system permease protein
VLSAVSGYYTAVLLDVSISGMMTVSAGALFGLAALFSPSHGLVAKAIRRSKLRERFAADLLVMHLAHHRTAAETLDSLAHELNWSPNWLERVVRRGTQEETIVVERQAVQLTDKGRSAADRIAASLEPA